MRLLGLTIILSGRCCRLAGPQPCMKTHLICWAGMGQENRKARILDMVRV